MIELEVKSAIRFEIAIEFTKAVGHIQNFQKSEGKIDIVVDFNMEMIKHLNFLEPGRIPLVKSFKHLNHQNEVALETVYAALSFNLNSQNNSNLS